MVLCYVRLQDIQLLQVRTSLNPYCNTTLNLKMEFRGFFVSQYSIRSAFNSVGEKEGEMLIRDHSFY